MMSINYAYYAVTYYAPMSQREPLPDGLCLLRTKLSPMVYPDHGEERILLLFSFTPMPKPYSVLLS